jgi:hypothetical protein
MEQSVAQLLGFGGSEVAVEDKHLSPDEQVDACEGKLAPGGVDGEDSGQNRPKPVSLRKMRSSTRAWPRWQASRNWIEPPPGGVSVAMT